MYSATINTALVNSRIDELHRDAQPIVSPRIADVVKHQDFQAFCSRGRIR
jgi:hypothetical protein